MPDPQTPPEPDAGITGGVSTDPDGHPEYELYEVASGPLITARVEGLRIPRRPNAGSRGVILADVPAGLVYLLDADDDRKVFVGRDKRALAGDLDDIDHPRNGSDHLLRAAYEFEYDVMAAPWDSTTATAETTTEGDG